MYTKFSVSKDWEKKKSKKGSGVHMYTHGKNEESKV
jgi:hypothetical protein